MARQWNLKDYSHKWVGWMCLLAHLADDIQGTFLWMKLHLPSQCCGTNIISPETFLDARQGDCAPATAWQTPSLPGRLVLRALWSSAKPKQPKIPTASRSLWFETNINTCKRLDLPRFFCIKMSAKSILVYNRQLSFKHKLWPYTVLTVFGYSKNKNYSSFEI